VAQISHIALINLISEVMCIKCQFCLLSNFHTLIWSQICVNSSLILIIPWPHFNYSFMMLTCCYVPALYWITSVESRFFKSCISMNHTKDYMSFCHWFPWFEKNLVFIRSLKKGDVTSAGNAFPQHSCSQHGNISQPIPTCCTDSIQSISANSRKCGYLSKTEFWRLRSSHA